MLGVQMYPEVEDPVRSVVEGEVVPVESCSAIGTRTLMDQKNQSSYSHRTAFAAAEVFVISTRQRHMCTSTFCMYISKTSK